MIPTQGCQLVSKTLFSSMEKHPVKSKLAWTSCANPVGQADLRDLSLCNFGLKIRRKEYKAKKNLLHLLTTKFVNSIMWFQRCGAKFPEFDTFFLFRKLVWKIVSFWFSLNHYWLTSVLIPFRHLTPVINVTASASKH